MKYKLLSTLVFVNTISSATAATFEADVPPSIITPNHVESKYLGELNYTDGAPSLDTHLKASDFVDTADAVRVFLSGIPVASIQGLLLGHESVGMEPNKTIAISEGMLNANSIWLTANTTTPYVSSEIDVKDGPVVLEVGTPILGLVDNAAFKFTSRVGVTHPQDQGKGGKYFFYHTSYQGELPKGYIHVKTDGYQHWLLVRIITTPSTLEHDVSQLKKTMKLYPYGKKNQTEFLNITGIKYNTVHAMNHEFYDEINALIQYEPKEIFDPEWLSLAKRIGIEKGKPFQPDARMQGILEEAAKIATAEARSYYFYPDESLITYEDSNWFTPLINGHEFHDENGVINADDRAMFHFMATGITPDMVTKTVGRGSDYRVGNRDSDNQLLDGSEHYTVTLPPNAPATKFWSFMVYDNQTRSMLETDQASAGIDGLSKGLRKNEDGSITIHFAPVAPKGYEKNWVQTVPGKGFNVLFRMYGPTEAWFDGSWKPSDFQKITRSE
ncbi:DUF1254 domain-containing protein [Photobacterium sp. DA100]|uniref:DUF1254 domain-containing protein n=1 Tax=Photobacterium sp. DA100 TaxID=3027472 RepID=UPI00247A2FEE|nr:DUF1254 domain-containing protein [Photobacterium sp. DA100]WEM40930.1 DUF1254 domain-containing protein [Photobacterium sp. DA100]